MKSGNLKGKGYISALAYNFLYCVRAPPSLSSQLRNTAERPTIKSQIKYVKKL